MQRKRILTIVILLVSGSLTTVHGNETNGFALSSFFSCFPKAVAGRNYEDPPPLSFDVDLVPRTNYVARCTFQATTNRPPFFVRGIRVGIGADFSSRDNIPIATFSADRILTDANGYATRIFDLSGFELPDELSALRAQLE